MKGRRTAKTHRPPSLRTRTAAEREMLTLYRQQSDVAQGAILHHVKIIDAIATIGKALPRTSPGGAR